jgi:hypothetical protein
MDSTLATKTNKSIECANIIVNRILKHLENENGCEHCRHLLDEVFD